MDIIKPRTKLAREGWTSLIPAGRLPLPQGREDVVILWQQWPDTCKADEYEPGYGRLPASGPRECVTARACYWQPGRANSALCADFGAVCDVIYDAAPDGLIRRDIATLYAGYYPMTRVLCIGEVAVFSAFLKENLDGGSLVAGLWDAFEQALLAAFPAVATICTRGSSQDYYKRFYDRLLRERSYAPGGNHSYRKTVAETKKPAPECL